MANSSYDTIIIGAGVSGLALSLRLAVTGKRVLVLERNSTYGGKLSELKWEGFRWDKGPSLFTMPNLIQDLIKIGAKNRQVEFGFSKLENLTRYYFPNGKTVEMKADPVQNYEAIKEAFSERDAEQYQNYLKESERIYNRIGEFFLDRPKFTVGDAFKKEMFERYPFFLSKPMLTSLNKLNEGMLSSNELRKVANRFGTYNGSNPYNMSGLYALIPHLEHNIGTFWPNKGMRSIVDTIYGLAVDAGVEFSFDEDNIKVNPGKEFSVKGKAQEFKADKVVCGIDHIHFYDKILKDPQLASKYGKQERSSAAVVFYWAVDAEFDAIGLHNIFFTEDYKNEFDQIFNRNEFPSDPTIYVHNSSAISSSDAPAGKQNWFVMINTPAGKVPTEEELKNIRNTIFKNLKERHGFDVADKILFEEYWTAKGLESDTGAIGGALYGASSNGKRAALKRHPNKSTKYDNLYFCGGTAHPGGGIPLALKSAEIVANYINGKA
ncbi:MAG: phytoene desaturase family protein [Crocinitomicaceae bacterium]|nr:phytoene desaturase family protein [Crocinitomicaceae bacterium]